MNKIKNICVLGAGSWGTAIAVHLAQKGYNIKLWSFLEEQAKKMNEHRRNIDYLPDTELPPNIEISSENKIAEDAELFVLAVPSKNVRETAERFSHYINDKIIVNLSKGLEGGSLKRLSEVLEETVPYSKICVLSGPSHAEEVSKKIPSTLVAAAKDRKIAEAVQDIFFTEAFRVYTNQDIIGVELGGALKNIIALCAGISDGLKYGDNSKAALMTRGLTEIARLGVKMGADKNTFSGLTGIGDLIVTCTSMHSRNRRAGILIGEGRTVSEALATVKMVVEGVDNSKAAYELSKKHNVDMPIVTQAYKVLFEDKSPKEAVHSLMTRERTSEHEVENSGWY